MTNEKILEVARKDKYRGKEYENKESTRSTLIGTVTALIVGTPLFLLEYYIKGTVNAGLLAVGMSAAGADSLYEGVKLKKRYLIVAGAFQLLVAIICILAFVEQVVAA